MKVLIVGAGLYGSVCAHELSKAGHDCHVIDQRDHIGGNVYTRYSEEADCHEHIYGAHIFHTNSEKIWRYVNQFSEFNHYTNRVKVRSGHTLYSFPINLMTLHQVFGVLSPEEARRRIQDERIPCENPRSMEEFCLSEIGPTLYRLFIEGYTTKQWNRHPRELPADIIKRIPFRLNFDDNYFNDRYQGIPVHGYTAIIAKMLASSKVDLKTDFFTHRDEFLRRYDRVIFTGQIDRFFDFAHGPLAYRSLRFEREVLPVRDYQGSAVVNYAEASIPYTRVIEHKHFDLNLRSDHSVIYREYPQDWTVDKIPFYPVGDANNLSIFERYRVMAQDFPQVHFGGRLGSYRYFDMHQVIGAALQNVPSI